MFEPPPPPVTFKRGRRTVLLDFTFCHIGWRWLKFGIQFISSVVALTLENVRPHLPFFDGGRWTRKPCSVGSVTTAVLSPVCTEGPEHSPMAVNPPVGPGHGPPKVNLASIPEEELSGEEQERRAAFRSKLSHAMDPLLEQNSQNYQEFDRPLMETDQTTMVGWPGDGQGQGDTRYLLRRSVPACPPGYVAYKSYISSPTGPALPFQERFRPDYVPQGNFQMPAGMVAGVVPVMEDIYGTLGHLGLSNEPTVADVLSPAAPIGQVRPNPVRAQSSEDASSLAFVRDQVTPPGFLDQGKWKDLRPKNFRITEKMPLQVALEDALFFIDPKPGKSFFDPSYFRVKITGPAGAVVPYRMYRDRENVNRIQVVVSQIEPGVHEVQVTIGARGTHHISGSPLKAAICRNYVIQGETTVSIKSVAPWEPAAPGELQIPDGNCRLWGMAYDELGENLYASDIAGNRILKFHLTDGQLKLVSIFDFQRLKGCSAKHGKLIRPTGIAFDPRTKLLLVVDTNNHQVVKLTQSGELAGLFGSPGLESSTFVLPSGIAVSRDGRYVAVVDTKNHRILLFDGDGKFIKMHLVFGPEDKLREDRNIPSSLVFNRTGDQLCFTNPNSDIVTVFDTKFAAKVIVNHRQFGEFSAPHGLAADDIGNLLVCDPNDSGVLRIFSRAGILFHSAFGTGQHDLQQPENVLILPGGFVLVLDRLGKRLRIF